MNDFFEQDNFEDFFRENLEDYESEPSDSLWGKLQHNIPLKPAIGGGLVFPLVTLFTVVGISGLIYFSIQKVKAITESEAILTYQITSKTELIEPLEQQDENPAQEQQNKKSLLEQNFFSSTNEWSKKGDLEKLVLKSKKRNVVESIAEPKEVVKDQAVERSQWKLEAKSFQERTLSIPSKIKKENDVPNTKELFTSKQTSTIATLTNTLSFSEREENKRFFSKKNIQPNSKNNETNVLQQLEPSHRYTSILMPKGKSGQLLSILPSNSVSVLLQEPSEPKVKTRTIQKGEWSLEVSYSPHIWTSLKAKKENYQTKQLLGNFYEMTNYGVVFTERRKNGWGFEGGFVYGRYNLNHELNETLTFSYINNFLDENGALTGIYSLNIQSPFWKEDHPVNIKYTQIQEPFLQEGEEVQLKGYHTQKMNNFQITAGANYQMQLNSKVNLVFQGGVAWSFLRVSGGSLSDAYLNKEFLVIEQAEESEKRVFESIDAYIGAGLEYSLTNQFKIKLAPRYVTTFRNRANHNDQISLRSFQLNVGLSYPLNK